MQPNLDTLDVGIVALSKDSVEEAAIHKTRDRLSLTLLADPNLEVIRQYGVEHHKGFGFTTGKITVGGTFTTDIVYPDESVESDSGTISIVVDMLKMYSSVTMETDAVHCLVTGADSMTLRNNNDRYDFDGDGTGERCYMILELERQ